MTSRAADRPSSARFTHLTNAIQRRSSSGWGRRALAGAAAPAGAQVDQDGLVNVFIGEVEILNDANIGVAAAVAANVCGVKVGPVAVLGRAVDRSGDTEIVCTTEQGPVTIRQN